MAQTKQSRSRSGTGSSRKSSSSNRSGSSRGGSGSPSSGSGRSSSRGSSADKQLQGGPAGGLDGASKDEELYRRAAEDALQQLDWAIGYLHGIHKTEISKALAKNRSQIRQRLLGEDAEPDPSAQTDET
jgi:hypothetical protein